MLGWLLHSTPPSCRRLVLQAAALCTSVHPSTAQLLFTVQPERNGSCQTSAPMPP